MRELTRVSTYVPARTSLPNSSCIKRNCIWQRNPNTAHILADVARQKAAVNLPQAFRKYVQTPEQLSNLIVTGTLEKKTQAVHIFAFIVATASGFEHASLDPQHSPSTFAKKTAQLRNADDTYVLLYPSCPDFAQSATRLATLQGHVKLAPREKCEVFLEQHFLVRGS
jgi:hypothetical protein